MKITKNKLNYLI